MLYRRYAAWPPPTALRLAQPSHTPKCLSQCRPFTVSTSSPHGCTSPSASSSTGSSPRAQQHRSSKNTPLLLLPRDPPQPQPRRHASSSSSNTRWVTRQKSDRFAKEAKVQNLKSRAAFKLLQINDRYRIFRPGMTVVDLGFAPGSWSQVAIDLVRPGLGRVVGVDIIPVAPPKGVNGLQGDFLSPDTQERVRELLRDENAGRARTHALMAVGDVQEETSYIEQERAATADEERAETKSTPEEREHGDKVVDVVLSDMSAPWEITSGLYKNSLSNPYYRMMNTSGNRFKDHAGSMDLCRSALYFAYDALKIGGHFVCKFYQGAEDKQFEKQLKAMFHKVHREKPESSRPESKESFFVGIKRNAKVDKNAVFDEGS